MEMPKLQHVIYTPLPEQEPLTQTTPYSRVIELWPGEGSDPFRCSLHVVNLSEIPFPFEALSYVWGREQSEDVLLCCDSHGNILGALEMTLNLERALRALRLPNQRRTLWIDAICIRQDDPAERALQVSYMRSVYENATRVVVWLGLKDATMRRAFAFAQQLALLTAALHADAPEALQAPQQVHEYNLQIRNIILDAMRSSPDDTNALDALFRNEYFERVWCIQEVAAAGNIIAKCEDLEIDFDALLLNVPLVVDYRGLTPDTSGLRMWLAMAMMKGAGLEGRPRTGPPGSLGPILQVLMMIKNMKSTNPVDRIFAMLGCTDEGLEPLLGSLTTFDGPKKNPRLALMQKGAIWLSKKVSLGPEFELGRLPALKPNYNKSVCEVYRDFARYCIRRGPRVLDVLSHVQHHSDPTPTDEFPTWVPKFYEPRIASSFVLEVYLAGIPLVGHYRYFAELEDNPLYARNIKEPNFLQAGGFRVDVVEAMSDNISQDGSGRISPGKIWSQLFPTMALFPRPTARYVVGTEALDVAFFMTLLAGGVMNVADLGVVGAPNTRSEAIDYITRQASGDIHEWLQTQGDVDVQTYQDLAANSWGATRAGGSARFETCAVSISLNRRVYRTRAGLLGLGPKFMRPGDLVVVLFGGKYPYILRQIGTEWLFLGDTYLRDDHVMRGRAVMEVRSGPRRRQAENFRIR